MGTGYRDGFHDHIGLGVARNGQDVAFLEAGGVGGLGEAHHLRSGLVRAVHGERAFGHDAGLESGYLLVHRPVEAVLAPDGPVDDGPRVAGLAHVREPRQAERGGLGVGVQHDAPIIDRGKLAVQHLAGVGGVDHGGEGRGAGRPDHAVELAAQAEQGGVHVVGDGFDRFAGLHGDDAAIGLHQILVGQVERRFHPAVELDGGGHGADVARVLRSGPRRDGLRFDRRGDGHVDAGPLLRGKVAVVRVHEAGHDAGAAQGKQALCEQLVDDFGQIVHGKILLVRAATGPRRLLRPWRWLQGWLRRRSCRPWG